MNRDSTIGNVKLTVEKHRRALSCGFVGALIFVAIYGLLPLNVTYDHWILNGYAEPDIIQHYAGWMTYRQSAWHWPLGLMDGLGNGAISFTDSIPWVSIFFKLIRFVLPETFQFFGLYIFLCLVLQGISAGQILNLFTDDHKIMLSGTALFCVSPILLERAFRHTALASHWLILFPIYLLLQSRKTKNISWKYVLLSLLAIGIHPYFLPMIYAIFAVNAVEVILHSPARIKQVCLIFVVSVAVTILAGYCIGAFGTGGMTGGGFGVFSMNINALINPTSCGGFVWSKALPILPQILGNYDGFNYLGLGLILAAPAAICYILSYHREKIAPNIVLIIVCIGLTLYALSNVVTYNDQILWEYPLPLWFMRLAEIFRASSRMFYPVYYCMLVLVMWCICQCNFGRNYLICALLAIQLWDLSPVLDVKYQYFKKENVEAQFATNTFYTSPAWCDIAQHFESIKMLNNSWDYALAAFGAKNGMVPDIAISRAPTVNLDEIYYKNERELIENTADSNAVYLTSDRNIGAMLAGALPSTYTLYDCGGYIAITASAGQIRAEEAVLPLTVADLSNDNWQCGVWRHGERILLFTYNQLMEEVLRPGKTIVTEASRTQIENVQIMDNQWIHVRIADNGVSLEEFQYPAQLLFE